jgi:hypothetical protein
MKLYLYRCGVSEHGEFDDHRVYLLCRKNDLEWVGSREYGTWALNSTICIERVTPLGICLSFTDLREMLGLAPDAPHLLSPCSGPMKIEMKGKIVK